MLKTSRSIAATTVASSYPMSALPAAHQLTNIKIPRLPTSRHGGRRSSTVWHRHRWMVGRAGEFRLDRQP